MNKRTTRILLLTALMAAVIPLSAAQPAPTPAAPGHEPMWRHHEQRPFSLPSERIEARLAYLRTALKITSAQEPQWNAYADLMRKQARERDELVKSWRSSMHERMHERPNAIERLERAQSLHAQAVVRLNELIAVEKPLYAALTAEQKAIADEVLSPRRPGMAWRAGRPMGPGPAL